MIFTWSSFQSHAVGALAEENIGSEDYLALHSSSLGSLWNRRISQLGLEPGPLAAVKSQPLWIFDSLGVIFDKIKRGKMDPLCAELIYAFAATGVYLLLK